MKYVLLTAWASSVLRSFFRKFTGMGSLHVSFCALSLDLMTLAINLC